MTTTRDLDRIVRRRHLLKHPFYTAWSKGTLPISTLRDYAAQYYLFESEFPRYVAGAYARLRNPEDRRSLLENLLDEEGRARSHPELWADFARAIGVKSLAAPAKPATRRLLATYERHSVQGTAASALGAIYAYETQFPEVAREKSRGLRQHYGLRSRAAHEFFRVHTFADVAHSAAERRVLSRCLRQDPRASAEATQAVKASVDAWWGFLDGFAL